MLITCLLDELIAYVGDTYHIIGHIINGIWLMGRQTPLSLPVQCMLVMLK